MPASSAVHVTGRPVDRARLSNSLKNRSRPTVAWTMPRPASPSAPASASISANWAARLGTGLPRVADVGGRLRGREADRARVDRLAHQRPHPRDLVIRRRTLGRLLAHDVEPQRGVAEEHRHVQRGAAPLDRVEVLGEGLERPLLAEPRLERGEAHALDLLERAHDEPAMLGPRRRHAEAAVAHHHGGHPVPGRDREHPVPHHLRVVVGVDVDEAGRDHEPARVDRLRGGCPSPRRRATIRPPRIPTSPRTPGRPGAVDDRAAPDDEIEVHRSGSRQAVELGDVVVEDQAQLVPGSGGRRARRAAPATAATWSRCAGSRWPTSAGATFTGPSPGTRPSRPGT